MSTVTKYLDVEIDLEDLIEDHEDEILTLIRDRRKNSGVYRSIGERLNEIDKQVNNIRYDMENYNGKV